ncbi:hypothetical protein AB0H64_17465, partial [Nonomuraea sp. NPDC050733]
MYAIFGRLDEGARGAAFLGREADDAPTRVIKLLPAVPDAGPEEAERLTGVQRISSVYVARTLEAGMHGEQPYVVREHIEGRSLAETVAADGPLDGDTLERVAVGVLTALTAVHLAGVTHRGLTPHNVILGPEGPRVTDIDLGEAVGEVGYRSPEQISGLRYGPYADVFAWGAVIAFAATGRAPFGQDEQAVLNAEPEVGNLADPMRRVVLSALAKDVAQRPTTYTALLQLLGDKGAIGAVPGSAPGGVIAPVPVPVQPTENLAPPSHEMTEYLPPLEGVPVANPQPAWGPPPVAAAGNGWEGPNGPQGPHGPNGPQQQVWQAPAGGQQGGTPRRSFPVGLVAAVSAAVVLSAAGLWGAGQYADTQTTLRPVAAQGSAGPSGGVAAIG